MSALTQQKPKKPKKTTRRSRPHKKLCVAIPEAKRVSIAGTFNDWKPQPLDFDGDGVWGIELDLSPGVYEYLFVVDEHWMPDPSCIEGRANPYGGENSVLRV